jgi:hypothetical protein
MVKVATADTTIRRPFFAQLCGLEKQPERAARQELMESATVILDRCPVCGDLVQRGSECGKCLGSRPSAAGRSRRRLPVWAQAAVAVGLVVILIAVGLTMWMLGRPGSGQRSAANAQQAVLPLGELPSVMPLSEEATLLLALVTREPGKTLYEIDYHADGSTVTFAYSQGSDTLTREQRGGDGHGTRSVWATYGVERLQAAAAGATLSETPDGPVEPETTPL